MQPIPFKNMTSTLLDNQYRSENVQKIISLPVWTDGEMCISCWKMSFKERLRALFYGKVWIRVLSGSNQPPISVEIENNIFPEK